MFDNVFVRSHSNVEGSGPLDVGALVEATLFYGTTNLVLGRGSLSQLLSLYGADALIEFVSQGYVSARFLETNTGVHTENTGLPVESHSPVTFVVGDSMEQDVIATFRRVTDRSGYGRRKANAFLEAVPILRVDSDSFADQLRADFADESLLRAAVTAASENLLGPGEGISVEVTSYEWADGRLRVDYDDQWPTLRRAYRDRRGEDIGRAHLLVSLVEASADLQLASRLGSDISTGPLGSRLLKLKCAALQTAVAERWQGIANFQDHVLRGKQIREVVNAGQRDLNEVMQLLDKAHKFRQWIADQPFDADLVTEYIAEVTAETWADNLPAKVIRFATTTFAGAMQGTALGVAVGVGIGAADEFVLDNILKGWRPNQFVEQRLDPFVRT